jgi:hypothetical protein
MKNTLFSLKPSERDVFDILRPHATLRINSAKDLGGGNNLG